MTNSYISDEDQLISSERKFISETSRHRSKSAKNAQWCGIGLSGGGIRAATFSLGVVQSLASHDLFKHFDYLSTVSGGGYTGAALRWWWHRSSEVGEFDNLTDEQKTQFLPKNGRFGVGSEDFPFGTRDPDAVQRAGNAVDNQNKLLVFLRGHAQYLISGHGISFWSGVAVLLRSILLNTIVWIPIFAAVFWTLYSLGTAAEGAFPKFFSPLPDSVICSAWQTSCPGIAPVLKLPLSFALMIFVFYFIVAFFVFISIGFSVFSRKASAGAKVFTEPVVLITASILLFAGSVFFGSMLKKASAGQYAVYVAGIGFGILTLLQLAIVLRSGKIWDARYFSRRIFDQFVGKLFLPTVGLAAFGFLPVVYNQILSFTGAPGFIGIFGLLSGVGSALYGQYILVKNIAPGIGGRILLPIGALLFIYGVLLLSYHLALGAIKPCVVFTELCTGVSDENLELTVQGGIFFLVVIAILIGLLVDINYTGLHQFYRDRLVEAFMPSISSVLNKAAKGSPTADRLTIKNSWIRQKNNSSVGIDNGAIGPFPICNCNAILTNDKNQKIASRGGDNFVLTPFYCGSRATGWTKTKSSSFEQITFASAISASGAVANPKAGYVGTGATRNPLVSIAMLLLNVRLGYWVQNPSKSKVKTPNHFLPSFWYGICGRGHSSTSHYVELSDGGHFENLGLYELVRRKLALIVISDAEEDIQTSYSGLLSAIRRVQEDFGAHIVFDSREGKGPERLVPNQPMSFPPEAFSAKSPYLVAEIKYKDGTSGCLIYIKAMMIDNLSFVTKSYKGKNITFPHQSTADQFFEPEQFDAYQELGYRSADIMIDELKLSETQMSPTKVWENYQKL